MVHETRRLRYIKETRIRCWSRCRRLGRRRVRSRCVVVRLPLFERKPPGQGDPVRTGDHNRIDFARIGIRFQLEFDRGGIG